MRTTDRRSAGNVAGLFVTLLLASMSAVAWASPCLEEAQTALIDLDGGVRAGNCPDTGAFVMAVVCPSTSDPTTRMELARARALRDLSAFFDSDVEATEVTEDWEEVVSAGDSTSVEFGSSYHARVESSTASFLKGLQFHAQTKARGKVFLTYLISKSSIALASDLDAMVARRDADDDGSQEPIRVTALGLAEVGRGGVAEARAEALERARQQAIAQVLGVVVGSTVAAVDFEEVRSDAFAHSVGFVENYDILEERRDGSTYTIRIDATVTANKLYEGYQAYLEQLESPLFFVRTDGDAELRGILAHFLETLDLEVTDDTAAASYVVHGRCDYDPVVHPVEKIEGTRGFLRVAVHRADDGVELFSHENDPRKAISFLTVASRRDGIVVSKAFRNLEEDLHESLNGLIVDMARNGRRIHAYFDVADPGCRDAYLELPRSIQGRGGVRNASMVIDEDRGLYVLKLRYVGAGEDLAHLLQDTVAEWRCATARPEITLMNSSEIWFRTGR